MRSSGKVTGAVASRNRSSAASGMSSNGAAGSPASTEGSRFRRSRSVSGPALARTWARSTSESALRVRAWERMRTRSSGANFSGAVPVRANSGGRGASPASMASIQALMPAAKRVQIISESSP